MLDGTANTLMFGEKHIPDGVSDNPVYNGDLQSLYQRLAGVNGTRDPTSGRWTNEYYIARNVKTFVADERDFMFTGATHPGIAQFALCDGSVRSFRNTIALEVLNRLSVRNDGGAVSPADY